MGPQWAFSGVILGCHLKFVLWLLSGYLACFKKKSEIHKSTFKSTANTIQLMPRTLTTVLQFNEATLQGVPLDLSCPIQSRRVQSYPLHLLRYRNRRLYCYSFLQTYFQGNLVLPIYVSRELISYASCEPIRRRISQANSDLKTLITTGCDCDQKQEFCNVAVHRKRLGPPGCAQGNRSQFWDQGTTN